VARHDANQTLQERSVVKSVAILETGSPPDKLMERFGSYSGMFADLLGTDRVRARYNVSAGVFPPSLNAHDAFIISGSSAGVHDDLPWIEPLVDFLRCAKGQTKLVGICFGHQIMAHAFGGRVARAPRGWGIGLHSYSVFNRVPWMDDAKEIAIAVSHQDQVDICPKTATVVAGSDFTPNGVLAYTDQSAISFQCHPEFTPEYAAALTIAQRRIGPDIADAVSSLREPNDRVRVAGWLKRFLDQH
jgi:GMP synthase-like glutamine amidotransferase